MKLEPIHVSFIHHVSYSVYNSGASVVFFMTMAVAFIFFVD